MGTFNDDRSSDKFNFGLDKEKVLAFLAELMERVRAEEAIPQKITQSLVTVPDDFEMTVFTLEYVKAANVKEG
jgi:uncharacterized protein YfcZ (UPF0381/DUF406 family)